MRYLTTPEYSGCVFAIVQKGYETAGGLENDGIPTLHLRRSFSYSRILPVHHPNTIHIQGEK